MKENLLNDLNGSAWLRLTKSWWSPSGNWTGVLLPNETWWETAYPPDPTHKLRAVIGCAKPPAIGRDLTFMFTKRGEWVLDTFCGTGGLILGAALADRRAMAVDINSEWLERLERVKKEFRIADSIHIEEIPKRNKKGKTRIEKVEVWEQCFQPVSEVPQGREIKVKVEQSPCLEFMDSLEDESVSFIMTDPPYGIGHQTSFKEISKKVAASESADDFGNLQNYDQFLTAMTQWSIQAHRVLKPNRYAAVFVGDRFQDGKLIPLGFILSRTLISNGFSLRGIKVWRNAATQRPLRPYAIGKDYVPNIIHQYILILKRGQ